MIDMARFLNVSLTFYLLDDTNRPLLDLKSLIVVASNSRREHRCWQQQEEDGRPHTQCFWQHWQQDRQRQCRVNEAGQRQRRRGQQQTSVCEQDGTKHGYAQKLKT